MSAHGSFQPLTGTITLLSRTLEDFINKYAIQVPEGLDVRSVSHRDLQGLLLEPNQAAWQLLNSLGASDLKKIFHNTTVSLTPKITDPYTDDSHHNQQGQYDCCLALWSTAHQANQSLDVLMLSVMDYEADRARSSGRPNGFFRESRISSSFLQLRITQILLDASQHSDPQAQEEAIKRQLKPLLQKVYRYFDNATNATNAFMTIIASSRATQGLPPLPAFSFNEPHLKMSYTPPTPTTAMLATTELKLATRLKLPTTLLQGAAYMMISRLDFLAKQHPQIIRALRKDLQLYGKVGGLFRKAQAYHHAEELYQALAQAIRSPSSALSKALPSQSQDSLRNQLASIQMLRGESTQLAATAHNNTAQTHTEDLYQSPRAMNMQGPQPTDTQDKRLDTLAQSFIFKVSNNPGSILSLPSDNSEQSREKMINLDRLLRQGFHLQGLIKQALQERGCPIPKMQFLVALSTQVSETTQYLERVKAVLYEQATRVKLPSLAPEDYSAPTRQKSPWQAAIETILGPTSSNSTSRVVHPSGRSIIQGATVPPKPHLRASDPPQP